MKKIIEALWPRLEGDPIKYEDFVDKNTEINDEDLEKTIELAKFMYEDQKSRISKVESKSSVHLGFFGTAVTILSFALKDVLLLPQKELIHNVILLFGGLLIVYILQVMRYSIKTLERKGYYSFGEDDFLNIDKRTSAINIINKVKKNYDAINDKVSYMAMAHEFTKRIIGVLFFIALMLIVSSVHKYIPYIPSLTIKAFNSSLTLGFSGFLSIFVCILIVHIYIQLAKIKKKIKM